MEDTINKILLFIHVALREEEKYASFLYKLWTERKRISGRALQSSTNTNLQ